MSSAFTPSAASASVLGREAMRELDARSIAGGIPSLELMEKAGAEIAAALEDRGFHGVELPERPRLLVLAGRGNNGGDGFVVARLLASRRWRCTVALVDGEPTGPGDAATNLDEWRRIGGRVIDGDEAAGLVAAGARDFDLGLDAIFGTGLGRPVEGAMAELIRSLNESGLPVVSADIPSGLNADVGTPLGVAVHARATVTIGAAKPGLFLADGPDFTGRVRVVDIGLLDPAEAGVLRQGTLLTDASTAGSWPRLQPLAHKGSRGHVLVVAGSPGKSGAAVLAARGALRGGAGLVTVASTPEVLATVTASLPEAMTMAFAGEAGTAGLEAALEKADSIALGPGLGTSAAADALVELLLRRARALVVDADALNLIAAWSGERQRAVFEARAAAGLPKALLTPHPGEMGRLVETSNSQVQLSRKLFADKLAQELGAVVVLKGAATIVSDGMHTAFNTSGNAGMACAGMGDVLAGLAAALLARLGDSFAAGCLSVYVHGVAGDRLQAARGTGFLASELADELPAVLATRLPR